MSQTKDSMLSATYKSPTNATFSVSKPIPAPHAATVTDKTAYLSTLKQALSSTQDEINKELTIRMEGDKARDGDKSGNAKAVDDVKEEENYGEEVQEEED